VAVALLLAGFLVSTAIAVVEFVRLGAAERRVAELEDRVEELERGGGATPDGAGNPLEDVLEDLLEDLEEAFGGASGGDLSACISSEDVLGAGAAPPADTQQEQVRAISDQVEGIRELEFETPVDAEFLPADRFAARVREEFLADYPEGIADADSRILAALGAVPPGIDLRETLARALGSGVVGFYVPETGELVVRVSGTELGPLDRITLAHELDHALTDQRLTLPVPEEPRPGTEDADLAALAVVEGDATLVMQRYSLTLSLEEQFELFDPQAIAEAEAGLGGLPSYLEAQLLFPYQEGLSFVCDLFGRGGWEAVNDAYRDPPSTTAQVLFPERFAAGQAASDPRDPGRLSAPWDPEPPRQLGAADLLWLFEAPGDDPSRALDDPLAAARAWAGGELRLWTDGGRSAVGVAVEERGDGEVLCSATSRWYAAAFPDARASGSAQGQGLLFDGDQDAALVCSGHEIRLGIGPDLATARALAR
jgi:hypothetical protein